MSIKLSPVICSSENLFLKIGEQVLLNDASLTVHQGEKIGLVGRNGCGKSSFLKILAGRGDADSGTVNRKKKLIASYLSQEFALDKNMTVEEAIRSGAEEINDLLSRYEKLPHDTEQALALESEINNVDGWNLEVNIDKFITEMNIPPRKKILKDLSGGEKRRVSIARAVIGNPELLILDEPTNHLDTGSIEWLETFISNYNGTVIFVTHDRYFLDSLATRVVELSFGAFYSYDGSYSEYLIGKSKRLEREEKAEQKRQSFLRREISWIRSNPKARTGKSKSRIDRFEAAADASAPEKELDVDLIIPHPLWIGNKIASYKNIAFGYGDGLVIDGFTYEFKKGDKVGIIGRNGAGKTTLLNLIQGKLKPTKGDVDVSDNLKFNYVDQSRLKLNEENTVHDEIGEGNEFVKLGNEKITIWSYLKRFMFEDSRIKTQVKYLSGGEKGRLILAKLLKIDSNFLILDEPTNDLDLQTLRLLEEALIVYKGCVVLVSHDRYFLDRICNGIISIDDCGKCKYMEGNYFYCRKKLEEGSSASAVKVNLSQEYKKSGTKVKTESAKKLSWKEERELETIEENVMTLEEKIEAIETKFSSPDFFTRYAEDSKELNDELQELKKNLEELYSRWDYLEGKKTS